MVLITKEKYTLRENDSIISPALICSPGQVRQAAIVGSAVPTPQKIKAQSTRVFCARVWPANTYASYATEECLAAPG